MEQAKKEEPKADDSKALKVSLFLNFFLIHFDFLVVYIILIRFWFGVKKNFFLDFFFIHFKILIFFSSMFIYSSSTVVEPQSLSEFKVSKLNRFWHRSKVEEGRSSAGKAKKTRDLSPTLHVRWRRQIYLCPIWD